MQDVQHLLPLLDVGPQLSQVLPPGSIQVCPLLLGQIEVPLQAVRINLRLRTECDAL